MSLNWREIDLVLGELPLEGATIQRIVQNPVRTFRFLLYRPGRRFGLHLCLENPFVRVHGLSQYRKAPRSHQRFETLLHARINGGRITSVEHVNSDRIVRFRVVRDGLELRLYGRLWGSHANLILTDDSDVIVDAAFRKPRQGIVSGEVFSIAGPDKPPRDVAVRLWEGESFSHAIEAEYAEREEQALAGRLRRKLHQRLTRNKGRLLARLAEIEKGLGGSERGDHLQHEAELILANLHAIPSGSTEITVVDYRTGEERTIRMDPRRSPREQAQRLFDRAKRARATGTALAESVRNVRRRIEAVDSELESLDSLSVEALTEMNTVVRDEAKQRRTAEATEPGLRFSSAGHEIIVGRNARENDQLLRRAVRGNDWWLHTRDVAGGYVFVKIQKGKSVPLEVLLDAGNLAVYFSRARAAGKADLYYTQVKHLRRARSGPLGLVLPTQEKNLHVELDKNRLERLGIGEETI